MSSAQKVSSRLSATFHSPHTGKSSRDQQSLPPAGRLSLVLLALLTTTAIPAGRADTLPDLGPGGTFTSLAPGVTAARVAVTALGDVLKYRYAVAGKPFDTATGFAPAGPGDYLNIYSNARHFFLVRNGAGGLGVVWQDQESFELKLTWFGADRRSPNTTILTKPAGEWLASATGDDAGNVYYLTIQTGSGEPNSDRTATLTKSGPEGNVIASASLDSSVNGLDMVNFGNSVASLKYVKPDNRVAAIFGRTMHQTPDGLNHQAGIAVVFDGSTCEVLSDLGTTSSHSLESVFSAGSADKFLAIDLGDNYPRGVNLHRFTETARFSRIVSTFKTLHSTEASYGDGFPVWEPYPEISGGGVNYFKGSNDNRTYTELGGVEPTSIGYAVSFVGEPGPDARLIDNSRAANNLNDPRNIAFVAVKSDFASAFGMVVSDDLVLTPGAPETGGFYNFGGGWTPQRNAGLVWLTHYNSLAQNATRLKMAPRPDGNLLLIWEVWTATSYNATRGMIVAPNGTVVTPETTLTTQLRLGRRDDPLAAGSDVCLISGSRDDSTIELIVLQPSSGPAACPVPDITVTSDAASFTLSWPSTSGCSYQLQSLDLSTFDWSDSGAPVAGDGATKSLHFPLSLPSRIFRLAIQRQ